MIFNSLFLKYDYMKCKFLSILFGIACIGISSCTDEVDVVPKNDGQSLATRAATGVYTYPNVSEIVGQAVVKNKMDEAWNLMKNNASSTSRSEYGFYIYKSQSTGKYYVGDIVKGPAITGCEGTNASISLRKVLSNIDVCAFFHCHTTLHYCPETTSRTTGPSQSDIIFANNNNLPGILRDYKAYEIYGGHSKDDSYKDVTFGPKQRPNIQY